MSHSCDVVIATHNRPQRLADCLRSLCDQSMPDFRVIVVDDRSDQPLDDVVGMPEFSELDIVLHRLPERSGPAAARNVGASMVDSDVVVFVDDDVRVDWRMLETHLAAVRNGDNDAPVVSCGPFLEPADWSPTPWNKWEAVKLKREADDLASGVYQVTWRQFHTGNNCMPVAAFRAAGGFDPEFKRAEDDELGLRLDRLGCVFTFEAGAIVWHYAHRTLESWLAIPRAYAVYDVHLDRLHPDEGYLDAVKSELARRRPELRAVRWLFDRPGLAPVGIRMWTMLGRGFYAAGLRTLSMAAFSAAYDLLYVDSLRRAEAESDLASAELIAWGAP